MAYKNNSVKQISVYRCPTCRQISLENKWVPLDKKGKSRCPECHLQSSIAMLKLLRVLIFKRGRMWVM